MNASAAALLVGSLLALAGCASMSPQECRVAHWEEQGYADGRHGYAPTRIIEHRKACAEVGIAPDPGRYRQGWERGVREYCTPANGVAQGRAGQPYRNVCPPSLVEPFIYWHQRGLDVYQAQRTVDDLTRRADQLQHALRKENDARKRRDLHGELNRTQRRLHDARRDLTHAERRLR